MSTTVRVQARASSGYFGLEVGPWDEARFEGNGGFEFGMSAEVHAFTPSRKGEEVDFEVSFGAIGSHDAATARRRLASYKTAIAIAEQLNALIALDAREDGLDDSFERYAKLFDGTSYNVSTSGGRNPLSS